MGGGAWPFVVGGLSCQVYSGNERDLSLLNREGQVVSPDRFSLLRGTPDNYLSQRKLEAKTGL